MKFEACTFHFFTEGRKVEVVFVERDAAKWPAVFILDGDKEIEVDNATGKYKPCKTHCMDLIRWKLGKKASSNHGRKRQSETRPKLRLVR